MKELIPSRKATMSEKEVEFIKSGKCEATYAVGTRVVIPAQQGHIVEWKTKKGEHFDVKSFFAYILDREGNLLQTKSVSYSSLNKAAFAKGKKTDIKIKEYSNGAIKGEIIPNVSNIYGVKPTFGVVEADSTLTMAVSYAFDVKETELYSLPVLVYQEARSVWGFRFNPETELVLPEFRNLPTLVPCAVPEKFSKLPASWKNFEIPTEG